MFPIKHIKYFLGELYVAWMLLECNFWAFCGFISIPFVRYATKRKFRLERDKIKRLGNNVKNGCY